MEGGRGCGDVIEESPFEAEKEVAAGDDCKAPPSVIAANVAKDPAGKDKEGTGAAVNEVNGKREAGGDEGSEGGNSATGTDRWRDKDGIKGKGVKEGNCIFLALH